MGSGFNFFTNCIDKTPVTTGSWVDVDVSGDGVPSGSTGVILKIVNTAATSRTGKVRKNGSSDNITGEVRANTVKYAFVGIDANRIFEAYIGATTVKIYLLGYTDENVGFFDNAIDKTPGSTGSWVDVDVSGDGVPEGSTGVIILINNTGTAAYFGGVRKNGSSDTIGYSRVVNNRYLYQLCGLDANRIFEAQISNTVVKIMLVGYTKAPVTFFTNAIDKSISALSAWTDVDVTTDMEATADGAILILRNTGTASTYLNDVRKNGSSDNHTAYARIDQEERTGAAIGMDTDQIFENYISDLTMDIYLVGYCKPAVGIIQVTDSISLSDVILTNKTLLITDAIGLADIQYADKTLLISDAIQLSDQTLAHKTLTITDSISLSEIVSVITEIIKEVIDSISLSDQVLVNKTLTVTDQIQAVDAPLVNKLLLLQDAISLLDQILRDKTVTITDQIQLTEIIQTIVTGVWAGLFGEAEVIHPEAEVSVISPLGTMEVKIPTGELEIVKR